MDWVAGHHPFREAKKKKVVLKRVSYHKKANTLDRYLIAISIVL